VRILIIHQYYLSPGQAGGSRFNEFARRWSQAGHQVEVVAGTIDYSTSVRIENAPFWIRRRVEDGVSVWRCRVPQSYNRGYLGRGWAFLGFSISALMACLLARRASVIIATSPPLVTSLVGWVASVRHRAPWVFEIRDLWPESAITTGVLRRGNLLARLLFRVEHFACARANRINVLTPAFEADLLRRGLAPADRISFVPNGGDVDTFQPGDRMNAARRAHGWGERIVALYAGAHGRANALLQLVDAAEKLRDRRDILIVSVGDGPERESCVNAAKDRRLTNIQFLGSRPKEEMPALVQACDIGLAVLQDNPTFHTVYPNKVFDYMASERPTVVAIDGVARELVCDQARAGVFAEPENGASIAEAIRSLADDAGRRSTLGLNGRQWVTEHATRDSLAKRYLDILTALARR